MVEPVLIQRNNATPITKPMIQCLFLFLNNLRLSWCSPAIYPGPAICVASLKKTREGADTAFPVPLSRWMQSLSEKMYVGCWAQCRALSESSGPGRVCYWEALTLCQALPLTITNRAPDPKKWFHHTGKKVTVRKAITRCCAIYIIIFVSEGPDRRLPDPFWRNKGGRLLCKLNAEGNMGFGQRQQKTVSGRMNFTCKTGGA